MQQSDNQTTSSVHLMHQYRMQSSDITNNFVSVFDRSRLDAISLTFDAQSALFSSRQQTIVSVHLIVSRSNAIFDITFNRQCI